MKPPSDLARNGRGRRLWNFVTAQFDLERAEVELLHEAARTLDRIDELRAQVDEDGAMTRGSTGQPVLHPAIGEERLQRGLLARLLGQMRIPAATDAAGDEPSVISLTSARARRAARARWDRRGEAR